MPTLTLSTPIVNSSWLQEYIHHPKLVLLDATISKVTAQKNSSNPIQQGIKGAQYMDLKKKFSNPTSLLPNTLPTPTQFEKAAQALGINQDSIIVIYDNLGIYSSARAWWLFTVMGHQQVAVLEGGLKAWKKLGQPSKSFQKAAVVGNFKAVLDEKAVVNATQVVNALEDANQVIIDARSAGRFSGQEVEPRAGLKSGHMPQAVNIPYHKVVKNGYFAPLSSLKAIFQPLIKPEQELIFSCGSGVTACIVLLAAQLAGYKNLKLYDGSWSEWGQLEDVPIASL